MNDIADQVFWGQGAFLTPQHLQQQDRFHTRYALALHRLAHPFHWGFEVLAVREDGLASGVVDLAEFALTTRSGLRIEGGSGCAGNGQVPERNLADLPVKDADPIPLYLVLSHDATVAGLRRGAAARLPTRHLLESRTVADPFDPEAPAADVDFVRYQLSIVTGLDENAQQVLQGNEAYKFAEILRTSPGRFVLSSEYVAPSTTLGAASNLARWTRGFRDLLVSKGQDFAAIKRQKGISATATSAQEVMRLVIMQTFARHIPVLHEAVRLGQVSPYMLYESLRRLVAEFSVFSEDVSYFGGLRENPQETELPAYDHDDLRRCFRAAYARAEQLIRPLTAGAEVGINLVHDPGDGYYKAALPATLFESEKRRFYLAIESESRGQELFARLSETGKICTIEGMPKLRNWATFGLRIELLAHPPTELPQRTPNTTYFLVDARDPFWQQIRQQRNIAVFTDLPVDSTVIKLFPVDGDA